MKILIACTGIEEKAGEICRFCAKTLTEAGHSVALVKTRAGDDISMDQFDSAILTGSVRSGTYQSETANFVKAHLGKLLKLPTLFLSVPEEEAHEINDDLTDLEAATVALFDEIGWHPDRAEVGGLNIPIATHRTPPISRERYA